MRRLSLFIIDTLLLPVVLSQLGWFASSIYSLPRVIASSIRLSSGDKLFYHRCVVLNTNF